MITCWSDTFVLNWIPFRLAVVVWRCSSLCWLGMWVNFTPVAAPKASWNIGNWWNTTNCSTIRRLWPCQRSTIRLHSQVQIDYWVTVNFPLMFVCVCCRVWRNGWAKLSDRPWCGVRCWRRPEVVGQTGDRGDSRVGEWNSQTSGVGGSGHR